MPTQHVKPDSHEILQDVANALLKARKIVIVTGAGISTNSGIPDFRSENGLYSLIQAQFDAASLHSRRLGTTAKSDDERNDDERPAKRRRVSRETSPIHMDRDIPSPEKRDDDDDDDDDEEEEEEEEEEEQQQQQQQQRDQVEDAPTDARQRDPSAAAPDALDQPSVLSTPRPKQPDLEYGMPPTTSPLSSPPCEDFMVPPSLQEHHHAGVHSFAHAHKHKRLTDVTRAVDSSPLSSPPPILFDPFQPGSPSDSRGGMSRRSSTTVSEADESLSSSHNSNTNDRNHGSGGSTSSDLNISAVEDEGDAGAANNASSSQSSNPGRINLPNMKGKDLFDASIWADPTRTSVFYKFATSLRQKVREAEPTSSHKFISHLRDRGKLVRCYTQNIDQIEEKVGLSTSLHEGPGSRGRFSRKTATSSAGQANKAESGSGADGAGDAAPPDRAGNEAGQNQSSQPAQPAEPAEGSSVVPPPSQTKLEEESAPCAAGQGDQGKPPPVLLKREPSRSGVECVFLHGSLELLRCFQCGRVCSWDDQDREMETLSGQQPECPHCVGATEARREKGKRALGVGKLRPDIVLYGEEHPNAHLISPIVTHDLTLCPDMLLILGTSLRVHGLKIMVREFAKAVHSRGGNVVFVNFTKPPESSWGDVIDYWIQWDCDAWVADLQARIPKLWQAPEPPRPKKKQQRESGGVTGAGSPPEQQQQQQQQQHEGDKKRPPAANPVALRDTKFTGACSAAATAANATSNSININTGNTDITTAPPATFTTAITAAHTPISRSARRIRCCCCGCGCGCG
ncbi:NAD-dependent histone deacetylase HST3 [Escovopsis weberi]|uniref:NAD-dependent histone deacetylase HST3 n=1 Tax=Escovopsis weberi TaxID=150374 RepID=A0A0M8N051_ESCWE|nr:NAD-dependent histone deacetylase HST3 [Escovopsis weberi]